jgi:hypothetical protein
MLVTWQLTQRDKSECRRGKRGMQTFHKACPREEKLLSQLNANSAPLIPLWAKIVGKPTPKQPYAEKRDHRRQINIAQEMGSIQKSR